MPVVVPLPWARARRPDAVDPDAEGPGRDQQPSMVTVRVRLFSQATHKLRLVMFYRYRISVSGTRAMFIVNPET